MWTKFEDTYANGYVLEDSGFIVIEAGMEEAVNIFKLIYDRDPQQPVKGGRAYIISEHKSLYSLVRSDVDSEGKTPTDYLRDRDAKVVDEEALNNLFL